jgi:hypothetical protein
LCSKRLSLAFDAQAYGMSMTSTHEQIPRVLID